MNGIPQMSNMAKTVVHLFGASGSGTSTLGRFLCEKTGLFFMDTDDYFWLPTDVPFTTKRERTERIELMEKDIDTLIMGCTHYPLLAPTLKKIVGEKVRLVNPAYETARELKEMLSDTGMLNPDDLAKQSKGHEFYVSDLADKFRLFAAKILDDPGLTTDKVDIEKY